MGSLAPSVVAQRGWRREIASTFLAPLSRRWRNITELLA